MAVANVAIVGRPNVGKSSIFNWLLRRRVAIVDPTSGVTRDRITHLIEHDGKYFEMTDTGGMGIVDRDGLTADVERQIRLAIDHADLLLFVVDAQTGITDLDQIVVEKLRQARRDVLCVVNKCDNPHLETYASAEFYRFGFPLTFCSAKNNRRRDDVIEAVVGRLPADRLADQPGVEMKIAVVGKRNAGKSTFINSLADSERVIVSEVPGTTRDSVDVRFEMNGKTIVAIDTAGVRKAKSIQDSIEFYSLVRAQESIRRADVVLMFLDAPSNVTKIDKQLMHIIDGKFKPCVLVVNKWDLAKPLTTTGAYNEYIDKLLPTLEHSPRAFITAKTGKNVQKTLEVAQSLFHQSSTRVSTAEINRVLKGAMEHRPPPSRQNRQGRIYYATQIAANPPTIVMVCNSPKLFDPTYQRYLLNVCREELPFAEVPIRLLLR
ncbi:MAG: ribosome biogenesis GTPase Der, partial [Planctomycetia bacterium]